MMLICFIVLLTYKRLLYCSDSWPCYHLSSLGQKEVLLVARGWLTAMNAEQNSLVLLYVFQFKFFFLKGLSLMSISIPTAARLKVTSKKTAVLRQV